MALQMSPVDAHSENQPQCYCQPAALLPEVTAVSSSQVEPLQCQLLECSSAEQVPLPAGQNPVPPSPREEEQRVSVGEEEGASVEVLSSMFDKSMEKCVLVEEDLRGGAVSEVLNQLEVSQSSVIDSSRAGLPSLKESAHPATHDSPNNSTSPRVMDIVEQMGSAAVCSSFSNSLNDAQKESGDAKGQDTSALTWQSRSFNQSTTTFSGETNPPSATYVDTLVSLSSTSAHTHAAAPAPAVDEDYCDRKEPLIIESSGGSTAAALLHYLPTGPASNRFWGIPQGAGLRGGAGDSGSWGHPPASGGWGGGGTNNAANQVQGQWGAASSAANQRSSAASQGPSGAPPAGSSGPQQGSNQQQLATGAQQQQQPQGAWDTSKNVLSANAGQQTGSTPSQGVWAAQAAKNVPNQPTNTNPNQDINAGPLNLPQGGNSGGGGGAVSGSGPATPSSGKPDPLANYREAIYSQDGWGGNQVNQDTQWDVPNSPEPKDVPLWKQTASNGTEVWEVNLRNGGQAPPPITQTKAPWGSTPVNNLGGTWGEDDESPEPSSMWTGVPSNNGPTNWAANPMGGPINSGPMGPTTGPGATANISSGMASGNGMWGGPKKEQEWTGTGSIQAAPGGWGDVRPPRMGMTGMGPSGPDNMTIGPTAPSHWTGPQNKAGPQWSGNVPPKEIKPTGWDEHSPPSVKRPVHNYDDGTAVLGNPSQIQQAGSAVSGWKQMPNPNVAGGRGIQQTGPPPGRMPPGSGMKDMSWGQTRNGSWDGVSDSSNMGNMWMEDKPVGGSWNEPPQTPTSWGAGPKPKTPTTPSWGESDDNLAWGQPPKQVPKPPLAKEMIWASKQFRILSEMGFKKEDVENVLRNCNMVMEDALENLRSGRMGMFGDDHSSGYDPMGPHGAPYPPGARFNHGQQMPFVHPGSSGAPHHLLSNPASGMGMNPRPYTILQSQQPPPMPPQVNQSQIRIPRGDTGVTAGGGPGSQPSPGQLRLLVQQIQMAVQAGHLNPQILNQPLAPQTLVLLNQLLQQIKVLQQLGQQHTMALSRPGQGSMGGAMLQQLVPQMSKTKQQIASLQQQIAAQQALYVKQQGQLMNQQPPGAPPGQTSDLFKVDSVHSIQSNLERMTMQDSGQSRLSQWKYPTMDNKDLISEIGMQTDFSRAPGSSGGAPGSVQVNPKPPLSSSLSSPNMNPVLGQDAGAWSTISRSQSETGWPDSNPDLSAPLGGSDVKDSWASATGSTSYSGISDLVPEFEPGKPWKGPQIKTADDDPTLTPGTFMSGTGLNEPDVYSNSSAKGGQSSTKASPPPAGTGTATSASESGFSSLGLSSSTWSFNPSSASSSATPSTSAPYSTAKLGPKSTWSDAPPPSADPWSAPKPRGPPPGITTAAGAGPKATSGRDWSTGGTRSPWPGSSATTGSGSSWGGSLSGSSSWLVLRNLTPQIDGSTLKTLCVQHGPLHSFHLYLNHGVALVRYSSGEEAAKAQNALNNCVLSNTTILADLANESDVQGWLQQLGMPSQQQQQQQHQNQQQQQQGAPSSVGGWGVRGSTPGAGSNGGGSGNGGNGSSGSGNASKGSAGDNWGTGAGGSSPWSTGPSSVWSTPSLDSRDALRATPSSLNSFLPGDLLGNDTAM